MARIERFEDVVAWQKARALTRLIYQATQKERFSRDFGLLGQIRRAAVSTMSNVAEGFERGGRGEFHQFLSTAKASCAELGLNYTLRSTLDTSIKRSFII